MILSVGLPAYFRRLYIFGRATSPVGCMVFKTNETLIKRLVGSTPTPSATLGLYPVIFLSFGLPGVFSDK